MQMDNPDKQTGTLFVAQCGSFCLIRVKGRGSFKVSPALKKFCTDMIADGCMQFVLDMHACIGMDSTFMGVIAGIALRLKSEKDSGVIMVNMSPKTSALLETLGLDNLITTDWAEVADKDLQNELSRITDLASLDTESTDKKIAAETVLEAHEDLVVACPGNGPEFQNVITYLKQEMHQSPK